MYVSNFKYYKKNKTLLLVKLRNRKQCIWVWDILLQVKFNDKTLKYNQIIKTKFYLNKFLEILLSKGYNKGIMVSSGFMD